MEILDKILTDLVIATKFGRFSLITFFWSIPRDMRRNQYGKQTGH
jgi:hypothetical protein